MRKAKSIFAKNSSKLFLSFCGIAVLLGAIPALVTTILFGFSQNKVMPKYLNKHIDDTLSLKTITDDLYQRNVKWASSLNFTVKTYALKNNTYVESDEVIAYQKEDKQFLFKGIGNGYITFTNNMDTSLNVKVNVSSIFHDEINHQLITSNVEGIESDGIVTRKELESIDYLTLLSTYSDYNFVEFKYLAGLKKIYVPEFDNHQLLSGANFNYVNKEAKFYLPESLYEDYQDSQLLSEFKQKDLLYVNYSQQSEAKYSLVIHPNGGTNEDFDKDFYLTSTTSKIDDTTAALMNSLKIKGKHLLYWYTVQNGEEVAFDLNRIVDNDLHIYAKWEYNTYKIRYHFNSVNPLETDYIDITYQYQVSGKYLQTSELLALAPNASIEDDNTKRFIFLGWAFRPDSKTVEKDINDSAEVYEYSDIDNDMIELYAIWAYTKVNVTYKYGPDLSQSENTVVWYGQSIYIGYVPGTSDPIETGDGSWSQHKFTGWGIDQKSTTQYDKNDHQAVNFNRVSTESNYVTIYGIYIEKNKFSVNYYDFDGTFVTSDNNHGISYTPAEKINFLDAINYQDNSFLVTGKHFVGWKDEYSSVYLYKELEHMAGYYQLEYGYDIVYIEKDESGVYSLENGINYSGNDYKLTAQYIDNRFDIVFDHSLGGNVFDNVNEITYGGFTTSMSGSTSKEGYSNDNYTYSATLQNTLTYSFKDEPITEVRSKEIYDEIKLYYGFNDNTFMTGVNVEDRISIVFTPIFTANTYHITFNPNGGTMDDVEYDYVFGQGYDLPIPEKVGYHFDGWQYGSSMVVSSGTWEIAEDTTFIAKWSLIEYTITYNLNGGVNNENNIATYTIETEFTFLDPTKVGYTFKGWFTDSELTNQITSIEKGSAKELNLYAKWSANTCKVYYRTGYGDNSIYSSLTQTVLFDSQFTLRGGQSRSGDYEFDGWILGGNTYNAGHTTIYNWSSESVTFTAKWKDTCVSGDTQIMLANGESIEGRNVNVGDEIVTWDFETGSLVTTTVVHVKKTEANLREVISLIFDDGTVIKMMGIHGFFDVDKNKFVDILAESYLDYVGDTFVKINEDGSYSHHKLVDAYKEQECIDSVSIVTNLQLTFITNGYLSYCGNLPTINAIPFNGEDMTFISEAELADLVAIYGLYDYENLAKYGLPIEYYYAFKLQYLSIMIGRGEITEERIIELLLKFLGDLNSEHQA